MRLFYKNDLFDARLLRTVSHSVYGGADVAECLTAADRVCGEAERSLREGHIYSVRDGFSRTSNYYRNAYIFLIGSGDDDSLCRAYHRDARIFPSRTRRWSATCVHSNGGDDSTAEECYFWSAAAELRPRVSLRGLRRAGAGSGDHRTKPSVSCGLGGRDLPRLRLGLGSARGGREPRLAACVADPGQF